MISHQTHTTKSYSTSSVERKWILIDVSGKILGRAATEITNILTGKGKTAYAPNIDIGDYVVVVNASEVKVTGRKELQKVYTNYSGYPGGLKKTALGKAMEKSPEQVVRRAVSGMLPKNKLRDRRLARLHIYSDGNHPYQSKFANSKA
ncbi:MAG: 50S ribosomal protein L13 [Patescibacteria group bacterium]